MVYRLSPVLAAVEDGAVAIGQTFAGCYLLCHKDQVADEWLVGFCEIIQCWNGLARADQNVRGCLRIDVAKGKALLVLINNVCRDISCCDFLEQGFV